MFHYATQRVQQGLSVTLLRHIDRLVIIIGHTARHRRRDAGDCLVPFGDGRRHLLGGSFETERTRLPWHKAFIFLVGLAQRRLAAETLGGFRLPQTRIQPDALIEYETFAVVVRAAAFLEILQDAAVELEDFL